MPQIRLRKLFSIAAIPPSLVVWRKTIASGRWPRLEALPGSAFACSLGGAMLILWRKPRNLLVLFMFSVIMQFSLLTVLYFAGKSLVNVELPLVEAVSGGALASLTAIVPLPAGGAGVGEGVFGGIVAVARGHGEAADYAPVFLICRLITLSIGVIAWLLLSKNFIQR